MNLQKILHERPIYKHRKEREVNVGGKTDDAEKKSQKFCRNENENFQNQNHRF